MKRSPQAKLEKNTKRQKTLSGKNVIKNDKNTFLTTDEPTFTVSDEEFEFADNFFTKQHFSLTRNWDIKCLLPWHTPITKLSKKVSGLQHSFIELNDKIICLANSKVDKKAILGKGAGGCVKLGLLPSDQPVAVKKIKSSNLTNEFEALILQSQNMLIGEMYNQYCQTLVMEYIEGVDLSDCLKNLTQSQKLIVAIKCCEAVLELHSKNIVHCDLKPRNIRIKMDEDDISVRLIDFGGSFILEEGMTEKIAKKGFGTKGYTAPEVRFKDKSGKKHMGFASDIYSLGQMFLNDLNIKPELCQDMTKKIPQLRPSIEKVHARLVQSLENQMQPTKPHNRGRLT